MREAGHVVRAALDAAVACCVPGALTADVDRAATQVIAAAGAEALFLNYPTYVPGEGFPAATCVSVNEEIVHGVPGRRVLRAGDVVSIDCGARLHEWCADAAITVPVGEIAPDWVRLLAVTEAMLAEAIHAIRPGRRWSEIARGMQALAEGAGFGIVVEYVGHGIGRQLHEAPEVPCHARDDRRNGHGGGRLELSERDFTLRPGMTLAIEPMLALGSPETIERPDGWTVATADGLPAAHFEQTIAVTADGADVLTDGRRIP
jgi:methionyl aminopeptidase